MATPLFNIGGLISGLDTASMIEALMAIERQPIVRYEQRKTELGKVDEAWGKVNTKLSALRSAVDKLRKDGAFDGFVSATSSDDTRAAVTVTGTPAPGGLTFSVVSLAKAHQLAFGEQAAADASLWSGADETLVLSKDGVDHEFVIDNSTTLSSLAAAINKSGAGLSAQVVQTAPGTYRLVIAADETGTAHAVTVTSAPTKLGAATELQAATDAVLDLGGGVTVTRASNTVTDLIQGVSVQLKQTGTVTVTTARDKDASVKAVKEMVDAVNGVLTTLKDLTSYNAETKVAGLLQGDATARKLAMDLRTQISAMVGVTGQHTSGGAVGISLTRDGLVTLDETKLRAALDSDFAAVARLLSGRSGSASDAAVSSVSSTTRTAAGSYAVEVTAPATAAAVTGSLFAAGAARDLSISVDGTDVLVSLDAGDDAATVAAKINAALGANGITTLSADVSGGALRLQESRYGSAVGFTVAGSGDWGLDGTHSGTDVEGTIGGEPARGRGQTLEGTKGAVAGLSVTVTATSAGSYGTVTVAGGITSALDTVLRWAEGDKTASDPYQAAGAIQRARDTLKTEIRRFDDQIAAFEVRLESREITLRKRFSAMESALNGLQSQTSMFAMLLSSGE